MIGLYKCASLHMLLVIPYYRKMFIIAVSERWPIYDCETECSFVYLIQYANKYIAHIYIVSRKIMWCRIFAITSSNVNRFWKFFNFWKQQ